MWRMSIGSFIQHSEYRCIEFISEISALDHAGNFFKLGEESDSTGTVVRLTSDFNKIE